MRTRPRSSSRRRRSDAAALRARREPLRDDAAPRDPRPLAGIAIPDESFFVPPARAPSRRARSTPTASSTTSRAPDDPPGASRPRRRRRACAGDDDREAIAAIFEAYAAERGKPRWGDKTPMYMRHLPLLERALPRCAVRPPHPRRPRCGALVPEMPEGTFTRTWAHPTDAGGVRVPVADGGPRRARARAARRPVPLPRGSLRGPRRRHRRRCPRDLRVRRTSRSSRRCSSTPARSTSPRSRISSGSSRRRRPAFGAGART